MGIWPFGRDPATVEIASRIINAATQNGYRVRGKLTIHFAEPQRQAEADNAADRCAALAMALLREAPDHGAVIGAEARLSADLTARYPGDAARARAVELAALHVVGDPALSDELRRAHNTGPIPAVPSSMRPPPSVAPPAAPSAPNVEPSSISKPSSAPRPPNVESSSIGNPSSPPKPLSSPVSNPPPPGTGQQSVITRRRGSSQIRSIQSLLMPPGSSPAAMAHYVAPLVKDSAVRLLIGFLRAHDLVTVRGVTIDENSAEMLANLVPVSDASPGGYEASRATELQRWASTLGEGPVSALRREVKALSTHLAKEALARAVVEAVIAAAFPDDAGLAEELARFPAEPELVAFATNALTRLAGTSDEPAALTAALTPLFGMIQDDLNVAAMIIKQSSGS